jgi:hypothetical protein
LIIVLYNRRKLARESVGCVVVVRKFDGSIGKNENGVRMEENRDPAPASY